MKKRRAAYLWIAAAALGLAAGATADEVAGPEITPEQAKALAHEAYVFAYPILENYKALFINAAYSPSKQYRAPFNRFYHFRKLITPKFTDVRSPSNDTLTSTAWLDLRAEPILLEIPEVPGKRYYSFQIVDAYTFNVAYLGARTRGWKPGLVMIAGPTWRGEAPEGVSQVIRTDSQFVLLLGHTAVVDFYDLRNAYYLQDRYKLETLSRYLRVAAPQPPARLDFPMWDTPQSRSAGFIDYLNFVLRFVVLYPEAEEIVSRAGTIGVGPGRHFEPESLDPAILAAVEEGVTAAYQEIEAKSQALSRERNGWNLVTDGFGTREEMEGRDLVRAAAAMLEPYGNSAAEAYEPSALHDGDERTLDGSQFDYRLHFEPDELPKVHAFWSITMYGLPDELLVENRLKRYSIGSHSKQMVYGEDGSLDLRIQNESPGEELENNWLPAPNGPFYLILRMYWPDESAIAEPPYAPPPLVGTARPERPPERGPEDYDLPEPTVDETAAGGSPS